MKYNKGQIQISWILGTMAMAMIASGGWIVGGFFQNGKDHIQIASDIATLKEQIKSIDEIKMGMNTLNQNFINSQIGRPLLPLTFSTTTAQK